jgi:hypothetical protein
VRRPGSFLFDSLSVAVLLCRAAMGGLLLLGLSLFFFLCPCGCLGLDLFGRVGGSVTGCGYGVVLLLLSKAMRVCGGYRSIVM